MLIKTQKSSLKSRPAKVNVTRAKFWSSNFSRKTFVLIGAALSLIGAYIIYTSLAATSLTGSDGDYHPVTPARLLDTRNAIGVTTKTPIAGGGVVTLQVAGQSGIPATNVRAVVVNVTATQGTSAGGITVWPTTQARPGLGTISYVGNESITSQAIIPVGGDGKISVYNNTGSVHVILDVQGYFVTASGPKGARYKPITATRIYDTRSAIGTTATTPVAAGGTVDVQITGKAGIPTSGVKSAVVSISAVAPTANGTLFAWASGGVKPTASLMSFAAGQSFTNQIIVPVGSNGKISVNNSSGNTHVVVDVVGYYATATTGQETKQFGRYVGLAPARLIDTRNGAALAGGRQRSVRVLGVGGVPLQDVQAVVVNISALAGTANSGFTAWPSGRVKPGITNVNFRTNTTVTSQHIVPVGAYGKIEVANAAGSAHFIVDVVGFIAADVATVQSNGTQRFPGDPNPLINSKAYWGATVASDINGNTDPANRHELPTGKSLSVRRTFWAWNNAKMITTAKADITANRLPFLSVKPPGPWADVASGKYDADLDSILKQLDTLGGPVWFAINHEPENDSTGTAPVEKCESNTTCSGTPSNWRAMQTKVRDRMNALATKNIAFMPILMTWTWDTRSGRTPSDWWVDGIWDAYIADHYQDPLDTQIAQGTAWKAYAAFAESKKMPYGTAEWGLRSAGSSGAGYFANTAATNPCVFVPRPPTSAQEANAKTRHKEFWDWGFANRKDVVVHSYFDSCINSGASPWSLGGSQLTQFQDILKNDVRVQRIKDLSQ